MDIIKHKYIFLSVSSALVLASIVSIAVFGFKQGIDFTGGTLWEIKSEKIVDKAAIQKLFPEAIINIGADNSFVLRLKELTEEEHRHWLGILKKEFGEIEELKFTSIGPAVGKETRLKAIRSFIFVLLAISLYIAFAFRKVSYPVSSWKYGIIVLITLFHDAVIPVGLISVLGRLGFIGAEINTGFIIAILTVMGFSVHDTIVVFDRIRENLRLRIFKNENFSNLINRSVKETLARSINTSLTLILVLLSMFLLGAPSLFYFVLVILIGTIVGTYSSICIASPLLTFFSNRDKI